MTWLSSGPASTVMAAYHLTERGLRVAVFERTVPAGGPTGRSSAIVRAYYTNQFLAEVAKDSMEIFKHFGELTDGADSGFRQTGGAFLHAQSELSSVATSSPASWRPAYGPMIEPDAFGQGPVSISTTSPSRSGSPTPDMPIRLERRRDGLRRSNVVPSFVRPPPCGGSRSVATTSR